MGDTYKATHRAVVNDGADDVLKSNFSEFSISVDEHDRFKMNIGTASPENVALRGLATLKHIQFKNASPVIGGNYVTLIYQSEDQSTPQTHRIHPGGIFSTTDLDVAVVPTLQANTAPVDVEVIYAGLKT